MTIYFLAWSVVIVLLQWRAFFVVVDLVHDDDVVVRRKASTTTSLVCDAMRKAKTASTASSRLTEAQIRPPVA